jgi:ABC-type uncharacterized transport system permease subunit
MKLILRCGAAMLIGMLASLALHFFALEYVERFHVKDENFENILFASGQAVAGRGFEAQAAVVPLNVLIFAVIFAVASFLILRRRAIRKNSD